MSINRKDPPPKRMERARSIDKLDYDWVESPKRVGRKESRLDDSLIPSSNKPKAYYNHDVELETKKRQLKSDGSMDSLSERKKKKKISYMYPERLYKEPADL